MQRFVFVTLCCFAFILPACGADEGGSGGSGGACGDGECVGFENANTCPQDCGGAFCGDGECVGFENADSCPQDCANNTNNNCTPDCEDKACGDDGCGGSCGECEEGQCTSDNICQMAASPNGPEILDLNTNTRRVTEGGSITFTAVVTDPDGIEDLIGGNLIKPDTGETYGAFATAASEGAYSLTLTWDQFHATDPIDFGEGETERRFQANFFDASGNQNSQILTLTLFCEEDTAACGEGTCQPLTVDEHCGACGNVCNNNGSCFERTCGCSEEQFVCDGQCIEFGQECGCSGPSDCPAEQQNCVSPDGGPALACVGLGALAVTQPPNNPLPFPQSGLVTVELGPPAQDALLVCNPTQAQIDSACRTSFGSEEGGEAILESMESFRDVVETLNCPSGPLSDASACVIEDYDRDAVCAPTIVVCR